MPRLAELEIRRVGYGHPDALLLIEEVQAEYVVRYGGRDETPLDPLMFEPPAGSFFVAYDGGRPVATGAWRRSDVAVHRPDDTARSTHRFGQRGDARQPDGPGPGPGTSRARMEHVTRPDPRKTAALSAALSGAVDLGALKARADAARQAAVAPPASPGADNGTAPWIVDVTEASFQAVVEQSLQVPVVVLLGASYSPESQQLAASLTRFATASGGAWILARVDLEAAPRIGQAFGVQSVPTVVAVAAGQPIDAFAGPLADSELSAWIARLLDALRDRLPGIRAGEARAGEVPGAVEEEPIEDPRIVAAEEAFERGDYIVRLDQPYRNFAVDVLEPQRFPDDYEQLPYDDVSWAYPVGFDVAAVRIDDPRIRSARSRLLGDEDAAAAGAVSGDGPVYLLADRGQEALLAARFRLADFDVSIAEQALPRAKATTRRDPGSSRPATVPRRSSGTRLPP